MSLARHGNGIQNIGMFYTDSEVITIWGSLTSRDFNFDEDIQGGSKKRGHRLMTMILSNVNRYKKINGRFDRKFAVYDLVKH